MRMLIFDRFSFYGLKAILELYFKKSLHYSDNSATLVMHVFIFGAYLMTVPSGYIADAYLGMHLAFPTDFTASN